jgi:hypothetical protein
MFTGSPIHSHITTHVLHNAPDTLERLDPLLLIKQIEPLRAF